MAVREGTAAVALASGGSVGVRCDGAEPEHALVNAANANPTNPARYTRQVYDNDVGASLPIAHKVLVRE